VPRAPSTTDAFNAVAEPRRRAIIDLLARQGALAVGAIVSALGLPQPTVSKHLAVLREVGIVSAEQVGQRRVYRLRPAELRTMYDWIRQYERLWAHQLVGVKERAERMHGPSDLRNHPRSG
jgi:DNA-binding transcriptional ArsR family regulator